MTTGSVTRLASIGPDTSPDDLELLREIVGDARVVALGESAHFVREFTDARAGLTRFLLERLGFTMFAYEFGVTAGFDLDPWIRGEGADEDLATICPDATRWGGGRLFHLLREHNRRAPDPARFVGIDVPEAGGSLLPALTPVRDYLADIDPALLPRLDATIEIAERFAARSVRAALPSWRSLDTAEQDALTATLARLRALMRSRRPTYLARDDVAAGPQRLDRALFHLDTAIGLDHQFGATHGLPADGDRMAAAICLRDRFMADALRWHRDHADPDDRIVLVAHNTHIQKTPLRYSPGAEPPMLPMGHLLAHELGDDYVAVALTHTAESVPEIHTDDTSAAGFTLTPTALDPPAPTSIEAAAVAAGSHGVTLVRTRGAEGLVGLDRIRAQSGWSYTSIVEAFDAVLTIPTATLELELDL